MDENQKSIIKSSPEKHVEKVSSRVIIITDINRIEGNAHCFPALRLLDLLNSPSQFIPLTEAVIYDLERNRELYSVDFISLNKNIIRMVMEYSK